MSYLVFARKYRPQSFEDVVAQEHVTRTLRNALKNNRVGSGYLFCGPRGTGKTTVARILAKAINCVNGPTETPCGVCPSCLEIASGASLDVLEIDAASNTGVDDIRTLRENVRYLPTGGKKRIYIIDEVHRLSGSAFDALLKTLEEPPPHVIFMFATTEPFKVPETILSRTQRYDFRRVSVDDLSAHLRNIAQKEGLNIDDGALTLLARKADGSVRDSLSLLDQIAAFAGDTVHEKDVVLALGLVDRQFLFDFVSAIAAGDKKKVLHLIKDMIDGGIDVSDFLSELLDHLRTLMILKSDSAATELLTLGTAEIEAYAKQAEDFSIGDILRLMKIISDLNSDLKSGLDERLMLEIAAVKMAEMESTVRLEDVLAALSRGGFPPPTDSTAAPGQTPDFFPNAPLKPAPHTVIARPGPEPSGRIEPGSAQSLRSLNLPQVQSGWESFLTAFRHASPMLASQLRMAELHSVKDNVLTLQFYASGEASMQLVAKPDNSALVTKALREHFKANLTIKLEIDRTRELPAVASEETKVNRTDPKRLVQDSPRLKTLVEKVDGEIIGVRKTSES